MVAVYVNREVSFTLIPLTVWQACFSLYVMFIMYVYHVYYCRQTLLQASGYF